MRTRARRTCSLGKWLVEVQLSIVEKILCGRKGDPFCIYNFIDVALET
jgi:hypothetical protein